VNQLNQYTSRTVPGYVNILGSATNTATVSVNEKPTSRHGDYFRAEVPVANSNGSVYLSVTNLAVQHDGSTPHLVTNITGHLFAPQTPEAFTCDLDGNLTSDGRWTYDWDAENRLVGVESRAETPQASRRKVEWQYDALGRRVRQTTSDGSSGTWVVTEDLKFVSDPALFGRHIAELNAANNALERSYVWGLDLSGSLDGAGGVGGFLWLSSAATGAHFCAYDGNGNVAALVKASDGTVSANYEYEPFGVTLRATGLMAKENPFRFSTKRTDETTDFVLYEYRVYNPSTGGWLSRDPIGEREELNLYQFAANNPLGVVDDHGLGLWPKGKPKPVPYPPGGPVDPTPHLPEQEVNPNTPSSRRSCRCDALTAWADLMNFLWDDIYKKKFLEKALEQCAKTKRSDTGKAKCCVIAWTGVQNSSEIVWYSVYGHVSAKPCNEVRDEIKKSGTIGVCYGKNTVSKLLKKSHGNLNTTS
jgi:RHS repeat-associated protein